MKRVFLSAAVIALLMASCTKSGELLGLDNSVQSSRHSGGSDDNSTGSNGSDDSINDDHSAVDDHNSNRGGGDNISAASVPAAVMTAFKTRFPDATRAEWKKLSDGNFKVQFFRGTVKWEATFTPAGRLVKLERD